MKIRVSRASKPADVRGNVPDTARAAGPDEVLGHIGGNHQIHFPVVHDHGSHIAGNDAVAGHTDHGIAAAGSDVAGRLGDQLVGADPERGGARIDDAERIAIKFQRAAGDVQGRMRGVTVEPRGRDGERDGRGRRGQIKIAR